MVRRDGRRAALQLLYALDAAEGWDSFEEQRLLSFGHLLDDVTGEAREFAVDLSQQVVARRAELDSLINSASSHWRVERMNRVDRSILRLAAAELGGPAAPPVPVVINEAVELAKEFGAADSAAFVNGVLNA